MWFFGKNENLPDTRTEKRKIGDIGENAVCEYLKNNGFTILGRNYYRKWGEIDIVARENGKIHFFEVKSISREINEKNISHEIIGGYRAEDNLHPWKLRRLSRIIQTYILDKRMGESVEWQFDIATVHIDHSKKLCKVEILKDIVL